MVLRVKVLSWIDAEGIQLVNTTPASNEPADRICYPLWTPLKNPENPSCACNAVTPGALNLAAPPSCWYACSPR